jgi:hypothetical protein
MMTILAKRSRILELYKLAHQKQRLRYSLFKLVRIQIGLVSGDSQGN